MAGIRVVLFDLDDTIWDLCATMARAHAAWSGALRALPGGSQVSEAYTEWTTWTDASTHFKAVKRDRPDLGGDLRLVRREAMRLACVAQEADPELLVEPGYAAWTADRNRPVFFDGAIKLLTDLKGQGLVVGAVSDGYADLEQIPEVHGLLDFAVFASEVGASKPEARIFEEALARATAVLQSPCTPCHCVMVGDSYQKDVLGARAVGMRTVWLDNPDSFPRRCCGQTRPESADACDARIERVDDVTVVLGAEI